MTNKILIILLLFVSHLGFSQTVGKIEPEKYQNQNSKRKNLSMMFQIIGVKLF